MDEPRYSLNLLCSPQSEERLLDLLLESAEDRLFSSSAAHSHGATHDQLSNLEQVMGRRRSVLVQVLLTKPELDELLGQLKQSFVGVGLRYWATAVELEGEIR